MENIFDSDNITNLTSIRNISTSWSERKNAVYFSTNSNHLSAKFMWNIIGSRLEVYSFEQQCNNRLVASFDFGQIFNDSNILITNVTRLVDRFEVSSQFCHPYKLVVVLSLANSKNYICIIDIRLNSVINTIEFPFNLSYIEVILSGPKDKVENMPLINELCCMNGCLAVGCEGGLVFFIDLILDSYSPEPLIPKKISMITHNSVHIEMKNKRRTAIFHNQVLCISLNIEAKNKGKFNYRADDGTVLATFFQNQVYISALHFVPQLSLICVGYNFGGFHLYNLQDFNLECCCNIDPDLLPVISFAYQAPENDPKNYSYLWVVRGFPYKIPNADESVPTINSLSTAFIYLLCYQNKKTIENYGILYDTFKLCCCKFEIPLTCNYPERKNLNSSHYSNGSRLLDMFTIHQILPCKSSMEDEESQVFPIDYNYLMIVWEISTGKNHVSAFYFFIFDLNQWYKSQMPKSFYVDQDGRCPFISLYSLNSVSKIFKNNSIQAIFFPNISMVKFGSNMFYSDIHSYPASLSFNMTVASRSQLCNVSYNGLQKRMIAKLNSSTSLKILIDNCHDVVTKCFKCGLIPTEYPMSPNEPSLNETDFKLFQLMNIALENNLSSLLMNFIKEDSIYLGGSELRLVLEWIWNKVETIKSSIDLLTKPLFDLSGCNVSQQDITKLVCYEIQLGTLSILLKQLLENSTTISNLGFDKLKARIEVVDLIRHYLKFILLFENFGLLPEQDAQNSNNKPVYSQEKLSKFYCKRREDIISLNSHFFKSHDILLIDILIKHLDPHLSSIWEINDNNRNDFSCLYPPKDLSSLLKIFLLDTIPLIYKESILLYFIYDLSECLNEHPYIAQKLLIFISSFNIQQGVRNFVEGLWFLDHQNYESALQLFIHPMVTISLSDFKVEIKLFNEMIQRIIELFLFENHFKKAMIFTMSCNHVLLDQEKNENLYIQILLLNGNLSNAFEFQRHRRAESNSYHLLHKLFFVCEKMNSLVQVCRIPLDLFEEKIFIEYLLNSSHPSSKMILVLYFIFNNKLIEAINIVKQFEQEFHNDENKDILNLIEAYVSILPSSSMNLAKEITAFISNKNVCINNDSFHQNGKSKSNQNTLNLSSKPTLLRKEEKYYKEPLYLSPGLSKSKITKSKHRSPVRKLFAILKTPDMKSKIINDSSRYDSVLKKPILKLNIHGESSESDISHKLKVSFSSETNFSVNDTNKSKIDKESNQSLTVNTLENKDDFVQLNDEKKQGKTNSFATPTTKRSRLIKKSMVDSPTHQMTLRSNKKN